MNNKTNFWFLGKCIFMIQLVAFSFPSQAFTPIPASSEGTMNQENLKENFFKRQAEDRKKFSAATLKEIEDLYQIANDQPKTQAAAEALKEIVRNETFSGANRVGCALVYLADIPSESANAMHYLQKAIDEYFNSWYGSSVQVGPLAQYKLGALYLKKGKTDDANELFTLIETDSPDSLDHDGITLLQKINQLKGKKKMTQINLTVGDKAPAFKVKNQHDAWVQLKDYKGQWVVLYFYPKDNTPGCTQQACEFTDNLKAFEKLSAVILGVSTDSIQSHQKFIEKQKLKFDLLSDPDHEMVSAYGQWKPKKFMGKEFLGVVRSTFIIDPAGNIAAMWESVKVNGHVEEVLKTLETLKKS